jgi:hypothetical protein
VLASVTLNRAFAIRAKTEVGERLSAPPLSSNIAGECPVGGRDAMSHLLNSPEILCALSDVPLRYLLSLWLPKRLHRRASSVLVKTGCMAAA